MKSSEMALNHLILTELERLRSGENRLQRLYPQLGTEPALRGEFMQLLEDIHHRADRLDSVLDYISRSDPRAGGAQFVNA